MNLAKKNNNLFVIGDAHWNYASYYINLEMHEKAFLHFNEGFKAFNKGNYKYESAKMLYGMADIKGIYRDYISSEILTIKSIEIFKNLDKYYDLYVLYNYLAIIQEQIKEFDKALKYYNKALSYYKKVDNNNKRYLSIYNNIGNIYFKKKDYKKAIEFYNKEFEKNISEEQYARTTDNLAYCKLKMNDTTGVKTLFFKALDIRERINNKTDITFNKIHISDYYLYKKDTINALRYSNEAHKLAKELKSGEDYLTTLQQLSKLDTKNSKKYLDRYIEFNDSLIMVERRTQNKFTRIEFETDEIKEESERLALKAEILSQQRIWIVGGSISLLLILSLLYFLRVQKVQNEKLRLESEQQKANEEVYVLTLQQQAKLEEERVKERNRISAELHDGILGKLFGTRVNLGFLGMQMTTDTQESHQKFLDDLQDIEKEIREVSHKLSDNFDDSNINFVTIIQQLLEEKGVIGSFQTHFSSDKNIAWTKINEITKANVYRIIQEALQNIIKHANAKNVHLIFYLDNESLAIKIKDDGVGFDTKKGKKGIGIKNINTRVKKLDGTLLFDSKLNEGTELKIIIPYTLI
ncbi:tetratricopeptide repeat-containing sensor histidine kinase [Tenacibaculum sp. M341]|uniref:tetratricopeptide repeat-containing sensor histidine kinase n=1 Tax=Tenacibaculum sp. M341 TaxID=2530339 RepID=UPI001043CC55|nr:tetratricopeptide repeat-containing sensor histidine kinase [Tenacibaculum sp. M341]TCI85389.1 tetratricopeptide repeat protein [Tenacibaculum sp. M341]